MERAFWESRYATGETRFDLGAPNPILLEALATWPELIATGPRPIAMVPGCGRGWDVVELARRGFAALGVDFVPAAIRDAERIARDAGVSERARFLAADLFALPEAELRGLEDAGAAGADSPRGAVDFWWECACYCAIDPARRDEYSRLAARLIRPGGALVFDVFPVDGRAGGPPFAIDPAQLAAAFPAFSLVSLTEPVRPSSPRRAGLEKLALLRRR